ncbi:MAG: cytosine deaminase [Acetobacteraceae bacterium]|nr:cytosine deaminase [Acetobacteraceae bacterium]
MTDLVIRDVRPFGGDAVDVLVHDDLIAGIAAGLNAPPGAAIEHGHNALLLPGLVEGHTHLDKTLWGGSWYRNEIGPTRNDRIENERAFRRDGSHDAATRSLALARAYIAHGTTRMRTHADIDTEIGLRHVHATMRTRETLAGAIEMQIVAFPQSGLACRPGTEDLMDAALREGADAVGGIDPCAVDRDPVRQVDALFRLAERHGKPIDIHLHEPGEMGAFSLDLILERTAALSMRGMVTISHGFCLGSIADAERDALLARMALWDVRIATTAPASSPVPPFRVCRAAGVTVYGGNDGVRDTWTPYAKPDMLDRAMHIGLRNALRRDDELDWALECVTSAAAVGCGFERYGLAVGCRADLVLLEAETVAEAIVSAPRRRLVVSAGKVTARDGVLLL